MANGKKKYGFVKYDKKMNRDVLVGALVVPKGFAEKVGTGGCGVSGVQGGMFTVDKPGTFYLEVKGMADGREPITDRKGNALPQTGWWTLARVEDRRVRRERSSF